MATAKAIRGRGRQGIVFFSFLFIYNSFARRDYDAVYRTNDRRIRSLSFRQSIANWEKRFVTASGGKERVCPVFSFLLIYSSFVV